ncbi:MAG: hypothetical protein V1790_08540 [Planctomycetota bacterium]
MSRRFTFSCSTLFGFLCLSAGGTANGGQIIGELTDPADSGVEESVDILSARIEQDGGLLAFVIETRGPIPTSNPPPNEQITYLWLVDADNNPLTGQPHEHLGTEFNVRAVISEAYGGGFVDVTGGLPGGGSGAVQIQGNSVKITIGLAQVANPAVFHWACDAFHAVDNIAVSANHETQVAPATPLPYVPPARVTVTTPLLMLSPSAPATGALEVELCDAAGKLLPNDLYHLSFRSSNDAVATVDETGLVTAHAVPIRFEDTPVVEVSADGLTADNVAVIRVTDDNLGVTHETYAGSRVTFYLPPTIEGVDLDAITRDFQVVEATDLAYAAQHDLMGAFQFRGGTQFFALDVASDPITTPCGISGNPVRLGWLFGQPVHNSCYIINVPEHRVPQWGVIFHEMGHNFTWASWGFGQFCMASDTNGWKYSEALATMAGAWSWYRLDRCSAAQLRDDVIDGIAEQFPDIDPARRTALADYQSAGANYNQVNVEVICDILWEMYDDYTAKAWYDLFSTFFPPAEPLPVVLNGDTAQATWLVAALSASAGEDLRSRFAAEFGFPIDDEAWPEMLAAAQARIASRSWQIPLLNDLDCDADLDLVDFAAVVGCLSGPNAAVPHSFCRHADSDADGDLDLADFARFQNGFTGKTGF